VFKAHKVLLELKVHKALKVRLLTYLVLKDLKAHKAIPDHKVHKDLKEM
jgi:hypothetical protein